MNTPNYFFRASYSHIFTPKSSFLTQVDAMPSPEEAQPYRLPALFEGGVMVGGAAGGVAAAADAVAATAVAASSAASGATAAGTAASSAAAAAVHHAVGQCSSDALAPTVVFVSKLMSVPAVDVRQRIATTDSATAAAAAGGGGLQRLTGALWKAPRRVQFDPSDPTDNNDDADADDDDDEEGSSGAAGGAAAGVASGSYGSGDNSSLPGQGKEMLLAFARVFSGVLRASDFGDDVTPAEVFEKNMASYTGNGSGSGSCDCGDDSAQPLFLLGPKHQPLEASESSISETAATASTATAASTSLRVTVASQSATDGGDSDDVISHVVALTPCAGHVLAGRADVILPPPPPLSSHPVTSSSSSTSLATSSVNEAPAAAAPASEAQSERQAQQRSPIALYLMMGDALEPVAEVTRR
jgi:hypothetical protein